MSDSRSTSRCAFRSSLSQELPLKVGLYNHMNDALPLPTAMEAPEWSSARAGRAARAAGGGRTAKERKCEAKEMQRRQLSRQRRASDRGVAA